MGILYLATGIFERKKKNKMILSDFRQCSICTGRTSMKFRDLEAIKFESTGTS